MLFSVNTTFYKAEQYIESVYKTIKEQTYDNWEWIVTDDFSNDNARDILIDISKSDKRVKYVDQKYKKEMFWNPQHFCNGDVLITMDSDDFLYPKAFEVYHRMLLKYPELVLITTDANQYSEDGKFLNNKFLRYDDITNLFDRTMRLYDDRAGDTYTFYTQGHCWGDLRAFKNMVGLDFNPGNKWKFHANDMTTVCLVEERGKVLSLPRTLYRYTVRDASICHNPIDGNEWLAEFNSINDYIRSRREGKVVDSILKTYEPIWTYTNAFLWNDLNLERTQKFISFNTVNELTHDEKILLKDLYFDHVLFFNEVNDNIDYYFLQLTEKVDFDEFMIKFNNIRDNRKSNQQFSVQVSYKDWNASGDFSLFNKFLNAMQGVGYYWSVHLNNFATIKIF
jgi:glycosyltransferase involved in cell wall biosynthesis